MGEIRNRVGILFYNSILESAIKSAGKVQRLNLKNPRIIGDCFSVIAFLNRVASAVDSGAAETSLCKR